MEISLFDQEDWNKEIIEDIKLKTKDVTDLVVYSRDWTVETIENQIKKGNIDLNPKFQRRNAWNDERRSKLIESLIIGIPVPEIVLAEDVTKKKSFIIIDGKQRLLTIAGFMNPNIKYWEKASLRKLQVRTDLNGISYGKLSSGSYSEEHRQFLNADIRCTIIASYSSPDILYDIFYRLNAGSAPLSTQELRQVLNKGLFADYLIQITNKTQPIHKILRLDEPDPRLRDVEIILRFLSFQLFGEKYEGNLKKFLDDSMEKITKDWSKYKPDVQNLYSQFNNSIKNLIKVFSHEHVGRKFVDGKWEWRFNKVLFEVEVYYFMHIPSNVITEEKRKLFFTEFKIMCNNNIAFRRSIEATTKTLDSYYDRFDHFMRLVNSVFGTNLKNIPTPKHLP